MAESISEGTMGSFSKQVGDMVELDEEIASIETDKIDVSVNATAAGVIRKLLVSEGDTVAVDQAIVEIDIEGAKGAKSEKQESQLESPAKQEESPQQEKEITKESLKENIQPQETPKPVKKKPFQAEAAAQSSAPTGHFPGYRGSRGEERIKMARVRKRTAERLKESQNTAAFLTTFNEVDMSAIMEFRKRHKDHVLEKHDTKLGFMGPVARASALALKQIPSVNAMIEDDDTIVYRDYIDLSVAVATPKGLLTPVLRNIEGMGIVDIEQRIAGLGKKARDGKLTIEDLSGGSFTISNSGIWGSLFGTPIINMPQTAVLGIYGIQERPVAVNGKVEIRPMMYTALTYDHRLIDGREAVIFLTLIQKYLQDPASMLLD